MEKVLGLAVVSSMLCVGSVLGKYVRGIVNTKEVSEVFTFCHCCAGGKDSEFSGGLQLRICSCLCYYWALMPSVYSRLCIRALLDV